MNENQTTYPTGAQDEEEIDLVALMVTLLHKLKPILLTAVVCAVIAGGLAGVKILRGGAVSAEDQVAYEEALAEYQQKEKDYEFAVQQYELTAKSNEDAQSSVQEALKQAQDYAEKSLLKNLDVYNVWTAQADLYIDSGYKIQPGSAYQNVDPTGALLAAYQKQLVSGDSMNAAADAVGVDVRYLKGVVTVELSQNDSGEYNGVMTLQAYAADQQTAEKILNALLGRLDLIHDKAAAAVCSHSVRVIDQSVTQGVSTELRALQQTSSEDVQNLQSQLVELQSARQALDDNLASAKSTWESAEEPALDGGAASSVAKYLLIGFLLGGVLACGVVVVKFLLDGMAWAALGAIPNLLDYPIAFGLLGLAGCFRGSKAKMTAGFVLGCFGRFMASFLSGFIFYGQYAPEGVNPVWHSLTYNGSYMLVECIICIALGLLVGERLAKELKKVA